MKFTFEEVKRILGNKERDISELTLSLVIKYPSLTIADIYSIFKVTLDNYGTKNDHIIDEIAWTNKMYSGKTMLQIQEEYVDPKVNWHSTYIFKNFYLIIDKTKEWEKQVKSKSLIVKFEKERKTILSQLKANYRDTTLQDKFEIVCEFIDLLEKRMKEI